MPQLKSTGESAQLLGSYVANGKRYFTVLLPARPSAMTPPFHSMSKPRGRIQDVGEGKIERKSNATHPPGEP